MDHRVFGGLAGNLPSFAHAFAFALLTALALAPWPRLARLGCVVCVLIDTVFELAQWRPIGSALAPLGSYFASGTFDVFDLAAIAAGGAAAYVVVAALERN